MLHRGLSSSTGSVCEGQDPAREGLPLDTLYNIRQRWTQCAADTAY